MKKLLCLLIAICLLLCLTACGSDETTEENNTQKDALSSEIISEKEDENSTNDKGTSNSDLPKELVNEAKYIAGSPSGFAIVFHDDKYYCTDGTGKVLGSFTDGVPYAKPSPDGYTLVELDDEFGVIDKNGRLLFTESSIGVTGFSMPAKSKDIIWYEYVIPSFEDNYLVAYDVEETYSNVTYSVGILNLNGDWISPLSSTHPILSTDDDWSETKLKRSVIYVGDEMFSILNYVEALSLYNISTNNTYKLELDLGITAPEEEEFTYHNGKIIWKNIYSHETHYFSIDTQGNLKKFHIGKGSGRNTQHSVSNLINSEYFWIDDELWDRKSLSKLPADKYNLYYESEFLGGYSPVIIENSAGTPYFALENADGYKFEPLKLDFDTYRATLETDGKYVMISIWDAGTTGYIYDYEGNFINKFESTMYGSLKLKNGIIRHYHQSYGDTYVEPTDSIEF